MNAFVADELISYNFRESYFYSKITPCFKTRYELTFVLDGNMVYFVNQEKYVLQKNDAILIRPGMHLYRPEGVSPTSYVSFNFATSDETHMPDCIYIPNIISTFEKNMILSFPYKELSPLFHLDEKLTHMLNLILWEMIDKISNRSHNPYIVKIINYINKNLHKPLTVKEICRHIHLSTVYTSQLFKAEKGITLIEFINNSKLQFAKNRILSGDHNLKSIAKEIGYPEYSYFSRLFKNKFGCSPSEYRKKYVNKST